MFYLIALLVTSHATHCLDERVSRVVDSRLDALVKGPVVGGDFVPQFGINSWSKSRGHAVVVLPQVRVIRASRGDGLKKCKSFESYDTPGIIFLLTPANVDNIIFLSTYSVLI